jgi:hypothetical protein
MGMVLRETPRYMRPVAQKSGESRKSKVREYAMAQV